MRSRNGQFARRMPFCLQRREAHLENICEEYKVYAKLPR